MNIRLFSVYESESAGERPQSWLVLAGAIIGGGLDYIGRYLYADLEGYVDPHIIAAPHAFAFAAVLFGLLAVGWVGITITHISAQEGVGTVHHGVKLDPPKNRPPARNLAFELTTSAAPRGIWLDFGHERYLVPELTLEQLEVLYQRVMRRNNKITYDLYHGENSPFKRAYVNRLRKWMLHNQLANEGSRGAVYMRVETTRAIQAAYYHLTH